MKVAFTGHRPARLGDKTKDVKEWIGEVLDGLKPELVITGMAQGVDQLAAWEAKDRGIPLLCVYPFKKKKYHETEKALMDGEDVMFLRTRREGKTDYYDRDRYMVDECDMLLAVWDGLKSGGTWLTIDYANRRDKPILYCMIGEGNE